MVLHARLRGNLAETPRGSIQLPDIGATPHRGERDLAVGPTATPVSCPWPIVTRVGIPVARPGSGEKGIRQTLTIPF